MLSSRVLGWAALVAVASCGNFPPDSADSPASDGGGGQGGTVPFVRPPAIPPTAGGAGGASACGYLDGQPVANAGPDQVVNPGTLVTLDGSGSCDQQGANLLYSWSGVPVPVGAPDAFDNAVISFTALAPGTFTVELRVDNADAWASDTVNVTVKGPPTVSAGPDRGGITGDTITLQGQASEQFGDPMTVAWTQVSGPPVALSDPTSVTPSLVIPDELVVPLVYRIDASSAAGAAVPDLVTVVRLTGPDTDGDLLDDAAELALGTDPLSPDTDNDGIPDSWEIGVHEGVDYAALGSDPRHRDVLVEVHAQDGVVPGKALIEAWQVYYAGLSISNPDGISGIAMHFVIDSALTDDFRCPTAFSIGGVPENALYRDAFHHLVICKGDGAGVTESIGGRHLSILVPPPDSDPTNDLSEQAVFSAYSVMLHEMGHSLGLDHGGGDWVNYKPNYPSYMNYEFGATINGSPQTIQGSHIALSTGVRPLIDECSIVESAAFAGVPASEMAYLPVSNPAWTMRADGSVDWNGDGTIASTAYERVVRYQISDLGGWHPECELLRDYDDVAIIASSMAASIPSNPAAVSKTLAWHKPTKWIP